MILQYSFCNLRYATIASHKPQPYLVASPLAHTMEFDSPRVEDILTSLLKLVPPTLSRAQISPSLAQRHRLLGLPPTPPVVFDSAHPDFLTEQHGLEEEPDRRQALGQWLVTDLYPQSGHSTTDKVMKSFFALRSFIQSSSYGHDILSDTVRRYSPQGDRVRLDLPMHNITILLTRDPATDTVTFENLLPTDVLPGALSEWLDAPPSSTEPTQEASENPAEYIADANDFWDGFSDEETGPTGKAGIAKQEKGEEDDDDDGYWNSYGDTGQQDQDTGEKENGASNHSPAYVQQLERDNRTLRAKLQQLSTQIRLAKMQPESMSYLLEEMEQVILQDEDDRTQSLYV